MTIDSPFIGAAPGGGGGGGPTEGTEVLSTGEAGGTKFLREDGDGSSSWQELPSGNGWTALGNVTTTGNASETIDVTGYDEVVLLIEEISCTGSGLVLAKLSQDGGTTVIDQAGDYRSMSHGKFDFYSDAGTSIGVQGTSSTSNVHGMLRCEALSFSGRTLYSMNTGQDSDNVMDRVGYCDVEGVVNAIVLEASTGTFDVMNVKVMGR